MPSNLGPVYDITPDYNTQKATTEIQLIKFFHENHNDKNQIPARVADNRYVNTHPEITEIYLLQEKIQYHLNISSYQNILSHVLYFCKLYIIPYLSKVHINATKFTISFPYTLVFLQTTTMCTLYARVLIFTYVH